MAKYSIDYPADVVSAMKNDLGIDGVDLEGKAVVVAWVKVAVRKPMEQLKKASIDNSALVSARNTARDAVAAEIAGKADAEAIALSAAATSIGGIG